MTRFLSDLIGVRDSLFDDRKKSGRTFQPSKRTSSTRIVMLLISFVGVLSAVLIFAYIFVWNLGLSSQNIPQTLVIAAAACALICGLYALWNMFSKQT